MTRAVLCEEISVSGDVGCGEGWGCTGPSELSLTREDREEREGDSLLEGGEEEQ